MGVLPLQFAGGDSAATLDLRGDEHFDIIGIEAGLAALHQAGIDKCHLMVFTDNTGGAAFWTSVGAKRRGELALYSLATAPH
jgi:aconitase A